jgi:hypothetical protein
MGLVGEPARTSPRDPGGGARDEGWWLCDVGAPDMDLNYSNFIETSQCIIKYFHLSIGGVFFCKISPS